MYTSIAKPACGEIAVIDRLAGAGFHGQPSGSQNLDVVHM